MWADRMETDLREKPDCNSQVEWPSDEEPKVPMESSLLEVSEETKRFLMQKCTQGVANEVRRKTWSRYPLLKVAVIKALQLDPMMRQRP